MRKKLPIFSNEISIIERSSIGVGCIALLIYAALTIFQLYCDLETDDTYILVARPGVEPLFQQVKSL